VTTARHSAAREPAPQAEPMPLEAMARLFKALGDPTRLAIFQMVRGCCPDGCSHEEASNSISGIASRFDVSLSTVSHHMKELRNAGLITCYRRGQTSYCEPDAAALRLVERFLTPVAPTETHP